MSRIKSSRRSFLIKSAAGLAAAASLGGVGLVLYKDQTWVASEPYQREGDEPARTAVIAYSRSGNTLLAAKTLARLQAADLFRIEAPEYPQSISGQMKASDDASAVKETALIQHPPIDLDRYDRVILSTPVWWYRPAVPMWSFVNRHSFTQQEVYLLMTGNSGYQAPFIEAFAERVRDRNGRFVDFHFIERGRVLWQLSPDELREEVRRLAAAHPGFGGLKTTS